MGDCSGIGAFLWGCKKSPVTLTGCSTPADEAASANQAQTVVVTRYEFADAWQNTGTSVCHKDADDITLNDAPGLWKNIAEKVFNRAEFKTAYSQLNPYQKKYAVEMLADRLESNFNGKDLADIHSSTSHWAACKTGGWYGEKFPSAVDLKIAPAAINDMLSKAVNINANFDKVDVPLPVEAKVGEKVKFALTLKPASFKSGQNYDVKVALPIHNATVGEYSVNLGGAGVNLLRPVKVTEEGTGEVRIEAEIEVTSACGAKERGLSVVYRAVSGTEYEIAGHKGFLLIGGKVFEPKPAVAAKPAPAPKPAPKPDKKPKISKKPDKPKKPVTPKKPGLPPCTDFTPALQPAMRAKGKCK